MKIRRIDSQDLLHHVDHFNRQKTHCRTVSRVNELVKETPSGNNLSILLSEQMKMLKCNGRPRNERKHHQVTISKEDMIVLQQQTFILYQKIKVVYNKLSELYKLNEQKLSTLLLKHIKQEYYIYQKQLSQLMKSFQLNKNIPQLILHHLQLPKLHHQMIKFYQFIEAFYDQKCLRKIQIMEENILLRENAIRQYTTKDRYKTITKAFCPKLITNQIDIVQEFKTLNLQSGKVLNKAQCQMFQRLRSSEGKISKIFTTVREEKEVDIFEGRKFTYVIR